MKLNFYDIDKNYIDYLRKYDNKIPYIEYKDRNKFLCGVVLTVNNINYYVPVSSNKNKYLSSFMIYDDNKSGNRKVTSSLRFSFMFPCPIECLTLKNLELESDVKYKILTQKEYEYCNKHINVIKKKAISIYNLSKNKELREKYNLCNFQLLEEKYKEYLNRKELNYTIDNDTQAEKLIKKYNLICSRKTYLPSDIEQIKQGCTITKDNKSSFIYIGQFTNYDSAVYQLNTYKGVIEEKKGMFTTSYEVTEYFVEENIYDKAGLFKHSNGVVLISSLDDSIIKNEFAYDKHKKENANESIDD